MVSKCEKGSITAFTAIIIMVLIVFMGLIIDATRLMYYKTRLTHAAFHAAEATTFGIDEEYEKNNGIIRLDYDIARKEVENLLKLNLPGAELVTYEISTFGERITGELVATYEYETVVLNLIGFDKKVLEREYIVSFRTIYE